MCLVDTRLHRDNTVRSVPGFSRTSPDWRPFVDNLSARSIAHALAVLSAMFRWLVEQRYVVANPFAGIKVRGSKRAMAMETAHAFTEGEWLLTRTIANGLEWSYGWQIAAAQRLRFMLDFGYSTGLRISELTNATLRSIEVDAAGDHWLHVTGKGGKPARVTLTPLARAALDRYLQERGLAVSRARWNAVDRQPGRQRCWHQAPTVVGGHAQVFLARCADY